MLDEPTNHLDVEGVAWLAGHQDAFTMVNGAQSARSIVHLAEVFR